ncbi:MAG: cation:proton antiporter [Desulfosalsimonadaceae bacterium]|nr:cation:proton antiporter [Desulfosalsimonadaceae bacterium]
MDFWFLLMQILLLLSGAFFLGVLAERLKQSPIIGYLLAGILIGPWVFNAAAVFQVSELGVALLLFSIGLEFSFNRLKSLGSVALAGGTLQVAATLGVFALGLWFFRPLGEALILGAMVALSSTAVVMRVLADRAEVDSPHGRNALGILLLQDLSVVPLVIMVSIIGQGGIGQGGTGQGLAGAAVWLPVGKIILGAAGLVAVFYLVFNYLVPLCLKSSAVHASRDLIILLTIVIAFGSLLLAHSVGLSPALGGFLAGMMLAESPFAVQIRSDIGSLRTLFVTLFFTSIGMLANPFWMLHHVHWISGGLLVMMTGKILIIYIIIRAFGNPRIQALATGITLAQIGEFSFVLATTARTLGIIREDIFNWIVSVTIVSIFMSPFMVNHAVRLSRRVIRLLSLNKSLGIESEKTADDVPPGQVFIIGFGPAGQQVADGLIENGIMPSLIEMRPPMARIARKKGMAVYMGDATQEEVLIHAGLDHACLVVVTLPDPRIVRDTVAAIRRLFPGATVIARSRYNLHTAEIEKAGAHMTVDEEVVIGKHLSDGVIECLNGRGWVHLSCACNLGGKMAEGAEPEQM